MLRGVVSPEEIVGLLILCLQLEILTQLKRALVDVKPKSFEDCVKWARQLFQDYYYNTIAQLLYNFPPDHVGGV